MKKKLITLFLIFLIEIVGLVIFTKTNCVYAADAVNGSIDSWADLKTVIENEEEKNIEIVLSKNLTSDSTITITEDKNVTIIVKGDITIDKNHKLPLFMNNGTLIVETTNEDKITFKGFFRSTINNTNSVYHAPIYKEDDNYYVLYDDLIEDGQNDDFLGIIRTHSFANNLKKNNEEYKDIEVRAKENKEYNLYNATGTLNPAKIKTNVDWKNATFNIHDENMIDSSGAVNSAMNKHFFEITNMIEEKEITKDNIVDKIDSKTEKLFEGDVSGEKNTQYFCTLKDTLDENNGRKKVYIRYGKVKGESNKKDSFLIDNRGKILNPIEWDYDKNSSEIKIYKCSNDKITVKNGNFITWSSTNKEKGSTYLNRGINVNLASNINIENITHEVRNLDENSVYLGFLQLNNSANLYVHNCRLFTRKSNNDTNSTYDLLINDCVNVTCNEVKSQDIDNTNRWGIMGSNRCKDVIFKNCELNRIDAHCGIYNLTIDNCTIGCKGIQIVGNGDLNIYNTKVKAPHFIKLRDDYGSTWKGNINIEDCTFYPTSNSSSIIDNAYLCYDYNKTNGEKTLHDFGYNCKMPNINISNLQIEYNIGTDINETDISIIRVLRQIYPQKDDNNEAISVPGVIGDYKNYVSQNILINGFNYKGNLKYSNIDCILWGDKVNYVFEDISIKECEKSIIKKVEEGNNYKTVNPIIFTLNKIDNIDNSITIYKDESKYPKESEVSEGNCKYTFNENGKYKIEIISKKTEQFPSGNPEKPLKDVIYIGTKTYEFTIDSSFIADELTGIQVTTKPSKRSYIEGQNFDKSGMVITASYKNGTSKEVTEYTVIDGNDLAVGKKNVTISYTEGEVTKTVKQTIEVAKKELTDIRVTNKPINTNYIEGQDVEIKGMVVRAIYNDETTKAVTDYTIINGTNLKKDQTSIKISYTEDNVTKTTTQDITVVAKTVTKIEIKKNPNKMEYYTGEELDLTGLVLKITYNDESTEEKTKGYTANVTKLEEIGEKEVKITYAKQEVILKVNVIKEKLIVEIKGMDEDKNEGITYLNTITQNMTEEQLKSKFETNGDITIEAKGIKGEIGTGSIIKISKNEEIKEYTLVITGDLTGDAMLDDRDLLRLARYGAGLDKKLKGAYLRAANVVNDDILGDDRDLLKMARVLVGLDNIR